MTTKVSENDYMTLLHKGCQFAPDTCEQCDVMGGCMPTEMSVSAYLLDKDSRMSINAGDCISRHGRERISQGGIVYREHVPEAFSTMLPCLIGGVPPKKKIKRKKVGRRKTKMQMETWSTSEKIVVQQRGLTLPDSYCQTYRYVETQRILFNTANATGATLWNMNSMDVIQNGGAQAVIVGWENDGDYKFYRKFRVLESAIEVRLRSREAAGVQEVYLHATQSAALPTTAVMATFQAANQYNIHRTLGPAGSADAQTVIRAKFKPEKFFGPRYNFDDTYNGTITRGAGANDPATLVYWTLVSSNPSINTVTTGGLFCTMTITQKVLVFEVDRDSDIATLRVNPEAPWEKLPKDAEYFAQKILDIKKERDSTLSSQ